MEDILKDPLLEMEATISKMKNTINGINRKIVQKKTLVNLKTQ